MRYTIRRFARTMLSIGLIASALSVSAADVSTFTLGTSTNFYPVAVMHGHYAFDQIRITFNRDVFVDFYDLRLSVVAPGSYSIPFSGFTYVKATRTATWQIAGQPAEQNQRFRAILTGVWEPDGTPLTGGGYTNEFSILTGDVTGDNVVGPMDGLAIENHFNSGKPYDALYDINNDNFVSPYDALIVMNILNSSGPLPLIASGAYNAVSYDPPPHLRIADIAGQDGFITLEFAGLPTGSRLRVKGKTDLPDSLWYPVVDAFATNGTDRVSFKGNAVADREFYRALFD